MSETVGVLVVMLMMSNSCSLRIPGFLKREVVKVLKIMCPYSFNSLPNGICVKRQLIRNLH